MLKTVSRLLITAFLASILLSGCVTFSGSSKSTVPSLNEGQNASNLRSALNTYQAELARETDPLKRQSLLLKNVDTLIQLGRISEAKPLFQQINQRQLTRNEQVLYLISKVDILNYEGRSAEAVPFLPADKNHFTPGLKKRLLITQVRVLHAAGHARHAMIARIKLQRYLTTPQQQISNADQIYADLSHMQTSEIRDLKTQTPHPDVQSWADFMLNVAPQNQSRDSLDRAVMAWISKHPDNTVPQRLISNMQSQADQQANSFTNITEMPTQIGLLLPFGGTYDQVAQDIKRGFTTASLSYTGGNKPSVSVVPISDDVRQQVLDMQTQGYDMIVGPLQKDNVAALNSMNDLNIPVLALNRMTGYDNAQTRSGFYQFGLIPEDETIQAAQYAIDSGLRNAAIIAPSNTMGNRLVSAFTQEFEALGGNIITTSLFTPKARDFGPAVRDALGITKKDVANARYIKQKENQRSTDFKPYIEPNLDLVMMIASPKQARGIVPQLRFYDAEYLRVLSNSMVFDGHDNELLNKDLNHVQFTRLSSPNNERFYALGHDAFSIIPLLAHDNALNYSGLTGQLSLGRAGIIHRHLQWAVFEKGQVEFLEPQDINTQTPMIDLR